MENINRPWVEIDEKDEYIDGFFNFSTDQNYRTWQYATILKNVTAVQAENQNMFEAAFPSISGKVKLYHALEQTMVIEGQVRMKLTSLVRWLYETFTEKEEYLRSAKPYIYSVLECYCTYLRGSYHNLGTRAHGQLLKSTFIRPDMTVFLLASNIDRAATVCETEVDLRDELNNEDLREVCWFTFFSANRLQPDLLVRVDLLKHYENDKFEPKVLSCFFEFLLSGQFLLYDVRASLDPMFLWDGMRVRDSIMGSKSYFKEDNPAAVGFFGQSFQYDWIGELLNLPEKSLLRQFYEASKVRADDEDTHRKCNYTVSGIPAPKYSIQTADDVLRLLENAIKHMVEQLKKKNPNIVISREEMMESLNETNLLWNVFEAHLDVSSKVHTTKVDTAPNYLRTVGFRNVK